MTDRIKLAEAMGWEFHKGTVGKNYWCLSSPDAGYADKYHSSWKKPPGQDWQCELCGCGDDIPDPENDANDDYAVLEWMRSLGKSIDLRMRPDGKLFMAANYKIGDYARAALKVIGGS